MLFVGVFRPVLPSVAVSVHRYSLVCSCVSYLRFSPLCKLLCASVFSCLRLYICISVFHYVGHSVWLACVVNDFKSACPSFYSSALNLRFVDASLSVLFFFDCVCFSTCTVRLVGLL